MAKFKKIQKGSTAWLNMTKANMIKNQAKSAGRLAMMDKINEGRRISASKQAARTAEYYKTKRSKSRATKISAAAAAMYDSSEKTKRIAEQEATKRMNAQVQYANLINGNQNKPNPELGGEVSNDKDNAKGWVNWN